MSKAHKQYVLVWFVAGATYPALSVNLLEDAHKLWRPSSAWIGTWSKEPSCWVGGLFAQ